MIRSSIAGRVAISVSILILVLFGLLIYIIQWQSQLAFESIIRRSQSEGTIVISDDSLFPCTESDEDCSTQKITYIPGATRPRPLKDQYREQLEKTLLWVAAIGVSAALLIGYFTSRLVSSPLAKIQKGMINLRNNDYKTKLENTGITELDGLTAEFNQLASELEKVEQLRKDLLSDTTHELKTPVTSLLVQLEALKDGITKPTKERISTTLEQVQRLRELIEQLQKYSILRSKTIALNKRAVTLKDIFESVSKELHLNDSKVVLQLEDSSHKTIIADKNLFHQMITNIMNNILVHAEATKITVSFESGKLTIADNGKGISKEKLPYIFERFYRVDESRSRKTGGLGLGLAIVKEIAEAHDWTITAESQHGLILSICGIQEGN